MKIVTIEHYYSGHTPMVQVKINMSKIEYEQLREEVKSTNSENNNKKIAKYTTTKKDK